jgi:cysteine desulfurase
LLIINNDIIKNLQLEGIINGSQQGGLRGGTESVPNIAGAYRGMITNFTNRVDKNKKLIVLKNRCLEELAKFLPMYTFEKYMTSKSAVEHKSDIFFVIFGNQNNTLPNTILLSVVSLKKKFCNIILKKYLEKKFNIIVAIGSACSTSSAESSHVVTNMGASQEVKRGVIRISFGDNNKLNELTKFILAFISGIHSQLNIITKSADRNTTKIKKKVKFKTPISTIYNI